jgi:hypothetical protein
MSILFPNKPTRKRLPKAQWEALKKQFGNKCAICKESEKKVPLEQAHPKAHASGGQMVWPMCANCHTRFDKGRLTMAEVKKIGISSRVYQSWIPKTGKKKDTETKIPKWMQI